MAADAALFRLKGLSSELGQDYRTDLAEAMIGAIRGTSTPEIKTLLERAITTSPRDELAAFRINYWCAQTYAIAGMGAETIDLLSPLFAPPSDTSVFTVDMDPAFDAIRDDPDFVAMLDRHR